MSEGFYFFGVLDEGVIKLAMGRRLESDETYEIGFSCKTTNKPQTHEVSGRNLLEKIRELNLGGRVTGTVRGPILA